MKVRDKLKVAGIVVAAVAAFYLAHHSDRKETLHSNFGQSMYYSEGTDIRHGWPWSRVQTLKKFSNDFGDRCVTTYLAVDGPDVDDPQDAELKQVNQKCWEIRRVKSLDGTKTVSQDIWEVTIGPENHYFATHQRFYNGVRELIREGVPAADGYVPREKMPLGSQMIRGELETKINIMRRLPQL